MSALWGPEDDRALDEFVADGLAFLPDGVLVGELEPAQATFEAFAALLRRVSAQVESGESIRLSSVHTQSPNAWEPQDLPAAVIDDEQTKEWDAYQGTPYRENGQEISTKKYALWHVGEDVGDARVTVTAPTSPQARALAEAVRQSLFSNIDTRQGLMLPLPQAFLPAPFRGRAHPRCALWLNAGGGGINSTEGTSDALFRVVVRFRWRAPRISARPALHSLDVGFSSSLTDPDSET